MVTPRQPTITDPPITHLASLSSSSATDASITSSSASPTPIPPNAVPAPILDNDHVMCTHGKRGFHIPRCRLNLSATINISHIPTSYKRALLDPLWHSAITTKNLEINDIFVATFQYRRVIPSRMIGKSILLSTFWFFHSRAGSA